MQTQAKTTLITHNNFLQNHSLVIGIVLMFIYTWTIDLANSGVLNIQVPFAIYITLGWGFIFVSLTMTAVTLGKQAVVTLLKRYLLWRVGWKWFLVALFLEPILIFVGVYSYAVWSHHPLDFSSVIARDIFGTNVNLSQFVIPFFVFEIFTNGEEMGWRGYVLPRLQAKYSALISTIILGFIWGFWHLPKFLPAFDAVAFGWFMIHIIAFAITLTWLYNNTNGSLLMVAICHAASNTVSIFVPMASNGSRENMESYIIYVLLEVITAIFVIIIAGTGKLSRTRSKQIL